MFWNKRKKQRQAEEVAKAQRELEDAIEAERQAKLDEAAESQASLEESRRVRSNQIRVEVEVDRSQIWIYGAPEHPEGPLMLYVAPSLTNRWTPYTSAEDLENGRKFIHLGVRTCALAGYDLILGEETCAAVKAALTDEFVTSFMEKRKERSKSWHCAYDARKKLKELVAGLSVVELINPGSALLEQARTTASTLCKCDLTSPEVYEAVHQMITTLLADGRSSCGTPEGTSSPTATTPQPQLSKEDQVLVELRKLEEQAKVTPVHIEPLASGRGYGLKIGGRWVLSIGDPPNLFNYWLNITRLGRSPGPINHDEYVEYLVLEARSVWLQEMGVDLPPTTCDLIRKSITEEHVEFLRESRKQVWDDGASTAADWNRLAETTRELSGEHVKSDPILSAVYAAVHPLDTCYGAVTSRLRERRKQQALVLLTKQYLKAQSAAVEPPAATAPQPQLLTSPSGKFKLDPATGWVAFDNGCSRFHFRASAIWGVDMPSTGKVSIDFNRGTINLDANEWMELRELLIQDGYLSPLLMQIDEPGAGDEPSTASEPSSSVVVPKSLGGGFDVLLSVLEQLAQNHPDKLSADLRSEIQATCARRDNRRARSAAASVFRQDLLTDDGRLTRAGVLNFFQELFESEALKSYQSSLPTVISAMSQEDIDALGPVARSGQSEQERRRYADVMVQLLERGCDRFEEELVVACFSGLAGSGYQEEQESIQNIRAAVKILRSYFDAETDDGDEDDESGVERP